MRPAVRTSGRRRARRRRCCPLARRRKSGRSLHGSPGGRSVRSSPSSERSRRPAEPSRRRVRSSASGRRLPPQKPPAFPPPPPDGRCENGWSVGTRRHVRCGIPGTHQLRDTRDSRPAEIQRLQTLPRGPLRRRPRRSRRGRGVSIGQRKRRSLRVLLPSGHRRPTAGLWSFPAGAAVPSMANRDSYAVSGLGGWGHTTITVRSPPCSLAARRSIHSRPCWSVRDED